MRGYWASRQSASLQDIMFQAKALLYLKGVQQR